MKKHHCILHNTYVVVVAIGVIVAVVADVSNSTMLLLLLLFNACQQIYDICLCSSLAS